MKTSSASPGSGTDSEDDDDDDDEEEEVEEERGEGGGDNSHVGASEKENKDSDSSKNYNKDKDKDKEGCVSTGDKDYDAGMVTDGVPAAVWCARAADALVWHARSDQCWILWCRYLRMSTDAYGEAVKTVAGKSKPKIEI